MPDVEEVLKLQQAYSKCFSSEEGQIVLADLQKVCFKNFTTLDANSNIMSFNEGQRAVLLHIETRMRMNIKRKEV